MNGKSFRANANRLCRYYPYVFDEPDAPPDLEADVLESPALAEVAPPVVSEKVLPAPVIASPPTPGVIPPLAPAAVPSPVPALPSPPSDRRASRRVRGRQPEMGPLRHGKVGRNIEMIVGCRYMKR